MRRVAQQSFQAVRRCGALRRVGSGRVPVRDRRVACGICGSSRQRRTNASSCVRIVDDDGGVGGQQRGDDVAEVPGVGAEGDGGAVGGRLDHVLAAAVAEAAADEGDCARRPTRRRARRRCRRAGCWRRSSRELAACGLLVDQFACGVAREVRCVEQLGDVVEALGMARHEDQSQARVLRREAAEDVDGVLLFGLLRAAGEEDDVVVCDAGQFARATACAGCCDRFVRRRT